MRVRGADRDMRYEESKEKSCIKQIRKSDFRESLTCGARRQRRCQLKKRCQGQILGQRVEEKENEDGAPEMDSSLKGAILKTVRMELRRDKGK